MLVRVAMIDEAKLSHGRAKFKIDLILVKRRAQRLGDSHREHLPRPTADNSI